MNETPSFPSSTAQFQLPFLLAGQSQKEFFVNQAFAILDLLTQAGVAGVASTPPSGPEDGESFIVGNPATGEFAGNEDRVAMRVAGAWHFVSPPQGFRLFDRSARRSMVYDGAWLHAGEPVLPTGGSNVDIEARQSIESVIQALRNAGIFAPVS